MRKQAYVITHRRLRIPSFIFTMSNSAQALDAPYGRANKGLVETPSRRAGRLKRWPGLYARLPGVSNAFLTGPDMLCTGQLTLVHCGVQVCVEVRHHVRVVVLTQQLQIGFIGDVFDGYCWLISRIVGYADG
jgi:hypothetical protein